MVVDKIRCKIPSTCENYSCQSGVFWYCPATSEQNHETDVRWPVQRLSWLLSSYNSWPQQHSLIFLNWDTGRVIPAHFLTWTHALSLSFFTCHTLWVTELFPGVEQKKLYTLGWMGGNLISVSLPCLDWKPATCCRCSSSSPHVWPHLRPKPVSKLL